jgi:hypothetical protein
MSEFTSTGFSPLKVDRHMRIIIKLSLVIAAAFLFQLCIIPISKDLKDSYLFDRYSAASSAWTKDPKSPATLAAVRRINDSLPNDNPPLNSHPRIVPASK